MDVRWFGPEPRRYREPIELIETSDAAGVVPSLRRADEALAGGYSVAGFVRYEAGAALVGLPVSAFATEPLLAIGVFTGFERPEPDEDARADAVDVGPTIAQISRARYDDDLAAIARTLFEGDAYQINYTAPFAFRSDGDALALFHVLRARARVPYASFVRHRGRAIVSLSPELFFELDGDSIVAKPMKGTAVPDRAADLSGEKNRAEHVMIVDLMRNDLGRICSTVDVSALFRVETYPTFATMTSTVAGRLEPGRTLGDAFAALFPCGSVTGAPKRAAMETIARLERGPRSIAMGTIGYCDAPRRGCWSVAIRTAEIDEAARRGEVRIGGGIVADSDAEAEWAEVLTKRRAFEAGPRPGLIETMRVSREGRIDREDAHFERLERSAFALGIAFDARRARAAVRAVASRPRFGSALVRLGVGATGELDARERELDEAPPDARICIAAERLRSTDPLLRHKSTVRRDYDAAFARARERGCFEAVLLNERGVVADGARTTVFVERDGILLTPALDHGALAGILRAELMSGGRCVEAPLTPRDLRDGGAFVGSSARGLIPVTLYEP